MGDEQLSGGLRDFACNGILFNHESPRRGETFVTRKITRGIAAIVAGKEKLYLGNLQAKRDWGFAPEYVEGQWRILQQNNPDDYVLGAGECHTVEEFLDQAVSYVNLDWHDHVAIDPRYLRPTEVDCLQADISKARKMLGWLPKVGFQQLAKIMVDVDMKAAGFLPRGRETSFCRGQDSTGLELNFNQKGIA